MHTRAWRSVGGVRTVSRTVDTDPANKNSRYHVQPTANKCFLPRVNILSARVGVWLKARMKLVERV